jgi:hypothetical protein
MEQKGVMDEFEKWLEDFTANWWDTIHEGVTRTVRDKYRSMTCKMEDRNNGVSHWYCCSECGVASGWDDPERDNYCPNCGRKVVE